MLQNAHLCQCSLVSFVFLAVQGPDPRLALRTPDSRPAPIGFDYLIEPTEISLDRVEPPPRV